MPFHHGKLWQHLLGGLAVLCVANAEVAEAQHTIFNQSSRQGTLLGRKFGNQRPNFLRQISGSIAPEQGDEKASSPAQAQDGKTYEQELTPPPPRVVSEEPKKTTPAKEAPVPADPGQDPTPAAAAPAATATPATTPAVAVPRTVAPSTVFVPANSQWIGGACPTGNCETASSPVTGVPGSGFTEWSTTPTYGAMTDCYSGSCSCQGTSCSTPCQSGCQSLCDRRGRSWTYEIGALVMHRSRPDQNLLVLDPLNPGSNNLNANDFNFGPTVGIEGAITVHNVFPNWSSEVRYFGIDDWSDTVSGSILGNPVQINNDPGTFISGPRFVDSGYSTELHNVEWNLSRGTGFGNWLVGLRYIQLNDQLHTRFTSLAVPRVSTEDYRVSTRNRLYGPQIGFNKSLLSGACYCFEAFAKGGIFVRDSSHRSSLVNFRDAGTVTFSRRDRENDFSYVGEIGLRGSYQICRNMSVFAAYRGLWIEDVALASDQVTRNNFAPGAVTYDDGDIFFHGGTFGIEFWF